jgi:hypothetical protein
MTKARFFVPSTAKESMTMKNRTLKIDRCGDWFKKKIWPGLRLRGQWLGAAGFQPGAKVTVRMIGPGQLIIEQEAAQ